MSGSRKRLAGGAALAVVASGLLLLPSAPAQAAVATKISTFPYVQDWSGLTSASTWADFPGIEGFTSANTIVANNQSNATDLGTLTNEGTLTSAYTAANNTALVSHTSAGVYGYYNGLTVDGVAGNKVVGLQTTGANAGTHLLLHLDTTGKQGLSVSYDLYDLMTANDQPQRVALQYRVGTSGPYTNVPAGYVADATVAANADVVVKRVPASGAIELPAAVDNQADVYLRILTGDNQSGSNEEVGIDNINITAAGDVSEAPSPVAGVFPKQNWFNGTAIDEITPTATSGTPGYTFAVTGDLPEGVTYADGKISGTPTALGSGTATITVTDSAGKTGASTFDWVVRTAPTLADHVVISEVWGDGGFSGAAYKNDYIELYNPTEAPIDLNGWSLAYGGFQRAAGVVEASPLAMTGDGIIPAEGYLLVAAGSDGSAGVALPAVDAAVPFNMDYRDGFLALLDTTDSPTLPVGDINAVAAEQHVIDAVGFGPANTFEGEAQTVMLGIDSAAHRTPTGFDSNNSLIDFTLNNLAPTNAAGVTGTAGGPVLPTNCDPAFAAISNPTIGQIQGTGAVSAGINCTVTTTGVVTAVHGTGGFNGFYMQTPGDDATPGASDGIFVWAGSSNANVPAGIAVGDSVSVTGKVTEFRGLSQIAPSAASGVTEIASLGAITPLAGALPTTDVAREALEGMLLAPTDALTITSVYETNAFGEIGLATGTTPLRQPTEFADATDAAAIAEIVNDNAARAIVLDDAQDIDYLANQANKAKPLPWVTTTNPPRVGAALTLKQPVVLDYRRGSSGDDRGNVWRLQPQQPVTDAGTAVAEWTNTRESNLAPQNVLKADGDIKIATFNVLNFFTTTGEAYVAAGPQQNPPVATSCTYYTDRGPGGDNGTAASDRISNNECGVKLVDDPTKTNGAGPRGAATAASLARQETKLAQTIVDMGADVIGLEEVENSIKLPGETNRDEALARIVELLNIEEGPGTWKFVRSPGEAVTATAVAEQDVIRPAFIYKPAKVSPVGQSDILFGTTEFANAREPLAQAFKRTGGADADAFAVIVNHFKSKGDNSAPGAPPAVGDNESSGYVGAFNGDRKRQAARLLQFADDFAEERGIEAVFLAGDFNSYSMEEPVQVIEEGGFLQVDSDQAADESYSFDGMWGSLDHVFANDAARDLVTGADIWEINANELVSFQYSRYNYNVLDLWQPNLPFATSDHNPEIVGLDLPDPTAGTTYDEVQIVGTNDFHGRLLPDAGNAAGAAPFATAIKELRAENPNTVFVAAGDLVGASTFESFIQDDEPTIDALNAMDLEVSAAGNHEFDRGYEDFVGRIQDHADWEYIAANVDEPEGRDDLAETWTKDIAGKKIGFIGAVTEDLDALVNPAGIVGVTATDVVEATNAAAEDLDAAGVDAIVLLVHEGAPTTTCTADSFTDDATVFGNIAQNTSPLVDAIISGHTHLAYNCRFPVEDWADRKVKQRPVVSAGQYGTNLNQLVFKFDQSTGELAGLTQDVIATAGVGYTPDPEVDTIVQAAVAFAATKGSEPLGRVGGDFKRATYSSASGTTENRGGESTLGNLVAEVQRWATEDSNDAQIAFMNPGGLRADMVATTVDQAYLDAHPGTTAELGDQILTYRRAADVQPFANTLVNMKLTGDQIKTVLEQQWQRTALGGVPSRPFLRLGVSEGFTYTYTETPVTVRVANSAPVSTFEGTVTGMWLNGTPIDPDAEYSVTANSFLAAGGDNFWELANGTDTVDTGKADLQAMVDYMEPYDDENPLPVDFGQRAVEVNFPPSAPDTYGPGDTVAFDVASWAMSGAGDAHDEQLQVKLGDSVLGTAAVNNALGTQPYDNYGTAQVSVQLPAGVPDGKRTLRLVGVTTGTEIPVEIQVDDGLTKVQVLATNDFHGRIPQTAANGEGGAAVLAGAVKQLRAANPNTVFAAAGDLIGASTFDSFVQRDKPTIDALNEAGLDVSAVGNHELDHGYEDLMDRVMAEYDPASNPQGGAEWQYIAANLKMKETGDPAVPATFIKDFGDIEIGFVGAVTEELPSLVSPDGIADLDVLDIVDSVNAEATALKSDDHVEAVVMLVHEGAPGNSCTGQDTPGSTWGDIVNGVNKDVDAIVSGHTHKAYDCKFEVDEWVDEDRAVTERPVVSAGQYGMNLNRLDLTFGADNELVAIDQALLPVMTDPDGSGPQLPVANYPVDTATKEIVDAAVAFANTEGNKVLGKIAAPFSRAKYSNGTDNRGSSSTAGNMIAEVQRWATEQQGLAADIAFMNPGGIREDMVGNGATYPRDLTYRQAANVQSFANSLINMKLTGAQIKKVLEQQWQRTSGGTVPTRAFLRLGVSEGFAYTYKEVADTSPTVPAGTKKGVVTGMWLAGEPISPTATYSVTVNSFLSPGGDNFFEFANGTQKTDWGMTDLESMVDYFDEFGAGDDAITPKYDQRAVEVAFPADAPASYRGGDTVTFDLAALAMTGSAASVPDVQDATVEIRLGAQVLGTAVVDNSVTSAPNNNTTVNNAGKAHVVVQLPAGVAAGAHVLTVGGGATKTEVRVPITVAPARAATVTATGPASVTWGDAASIAVAVSGNDGVATGSVRLFEGTNPIGGAVALDGNGRATLGLPAGSLEPGSHTLRVDYAAGNYPDVSSSGIAVNVAKRTATISADNVELVYGKAATVTVRVPAGATGTVFVLDGTKQLASGIVSNGTATVRLPAKSLDPGTTTLTASYSGDGHFTGAVTTFKAKVTKAESETQVEANPDKAKAGKTRVTLKITVDGAAGIDATGKVRIEAPGQDTRTATLKNGKVTVDLAKFDHPGDKKIEVTYLGNDFLKQSSDKVVVEVVKAGKKNKRG
ncbi:MULTISPECIES: ExeM/NucH family extracellular endonuclease [unclassified Nocardioides]|uniref:ExeM/NucH family extracellular endonuclease n=1 Tax=unclassified Nocardioides TaxID=2615069 RepID=UPI00361B1550